MTNIKIMEKWKYIGEWESSALYTSTSYIEVEDGRASGLESRNA